MIEISPAPGLDPDLRVRLCADAVAFARTVDYRNAGTVEFLVDADGSHVFIEMNPRIQVEHTVTEEVTSIDLVQAQLRIAGGETLGDLGIDQSSIQVIGSAVQCRITTEDPANGFRPDSGLISTYRAPGGAGVRLDGGTFVGADILPYYDSLLVKQTCRGRTFADALARSRRALAEFRVRGVTTNIAFLQAIMSEPDLLEGRITTAFLEEHPALAKTPSGRDRGTRLLTYLADVTVNRPNGPAPMTPDPATKLPALDQEAPRSGSRQRLEALGAEGFAQDMRASTALLRDRDHHSRCPPVAAGHPGSHLRYGRHRPAPGARTPQLLSLEAWGGATFDVALPFPAKRTPGSASRSFVRRCRTSIFRCCCGGATRSATRPTRTRWRIVRAEAAATGVESFEFSMPSTTSLRWSPPSRRSSHGQVAEGAICYTGDLSDPAEQLYTLDYYLRVAKRS